METHQTVHGGIDLLIDAAALLLAGRDRVVDQTLVCGLVRSREDERRVRRRILGLVDIDRCASQSATDTQIHILCVGVRTLEIAGVRDNDGTGLLEGVERGSHGCVRCDGGGCCSGGMLSSVAVCRLQVCSQLSELGRDLIVISSTSAQLRPDFASLSPPQKYRDVSIIHLMRTQCTFTTHNKIISASGDAMNS